MTGPAGVSSTHQIVTRARESLRCGFDPTATAVATLTVGETASVQTAHAFALYPHADEVAFMAALADFEPGLGNPLTGPIEVVGAEPGDTLVVRIDAITVDSEVGLSPILEEVGFLQERVPGPHVGRFPIRGQRIELPGGLSADLRPSVGVIGTCPATVRSSVEPGPHGGNLDNPRLAAGSTIYLPVAVPGAMMSLGDAHGIQGDSEWRAPPEVDATVQLTVERLVKDMQLDGVWAATTEHWIVHGMAASLEDAIEAAAGRMLDFLMRCLDLGAEEALEILSCVADMRLCTVTGGAWDSVVRVELPKSVDASGRLSLV